jgi:cell division protein FtsX
MFSSIHEHRDDDSVDTADRLQFVSGWFRWLGYGLIALWALAGFAVVMSGIQEGQRALGLLVGVGGALLGIFLTSPLYFWFAAIAAGVATLVERSNRAS